MAEKHSTAERKISKTQRRYQVSYITARYADPKSFRTRYYSRHPSLMLKGDWLKEAGFDTGTGVTVKISDGVLTIIAPLPEVQTLEAELYQFKQAAMGMKALVA
ncbi:SymE family type I addiction module toxin [Rahnella victoriana]|uniref:SymE family type I addiction module toxin n=1 Tax=Rahnella victoriana TaxID=1510570 RepID=UPI001E526E11|nr:SymE family type I addiction module toxin [Rahnella victoriana]UHM89764.1 SymE family type I addiction module toxin [Rahnella victoriana]